METKKCSKCGEVKESKSISYCNKCFADYRYFRRTGKHKEIIPEGYKKCTVCNKIKKIDSFYIQKGGKFGVKGECKNCTKKNNALNFKYKPKQKYPCIECGKEIYKQNTLCSVCEKKKPKFTELKCDWCNELKNEKCFSHGSKTAYKNGKRKIYCIDCKNKYQKEIDLLMRETIRKREFKEKHFNLKNGNFKEFKKYLIKSNFKQHKYMKEIDYESYELALKLKEEAAINKNKRQNEKRKLRRELNLEYKEHLSNLSRKRYNKNIIRMNIGDQRKTFNLNTCPDEIKDAVQGLIDLRKKNNFIKETKNAKIKG